MSREYPKHPVVGVGAVVVSEHKVLLVRRGSPPRHREWSLPGGGQKVGETVNEALHREVREETGVTIEIGPLLGVVDGIFSDRDGRVQFHYTMIDYLAFWKSGNARAGDDAIQVGWYGLDEIGRLGIWSETEAIIRHAFDLLGDAN